MIGDVSPVQIGGVPFILGMTQRDTRHDPTIADRNFAAGSSCAHSVATTWSARWAESAPPVTTRPIESFFVLLQKNVLDRRPWATRHDPRIAIVTWIERTYHRRWRQDALGRLTPIEYETIMTAPATQAA